MVKAKLPMPEEPVEKNGQTAASFEVRLQPDGLTIEKAVALEAKSQRERVEAQCAWIEKNLPGAHRAPAISRPDLDEGIVSFDQELVMYNGKTYSLIHLQMPDGKLRDVYFDLSGYFGM
ncbi:MAG: hypothetical protein JSS11_16180 [Verrucomicrobia bacterium]|nr:hypothetical protein [Verrucomicrobiota bacterium]